MRARSLHLGRPLPERRRPRSTVCSVRRFPVEGHARRRLRRAHRHRHQPRSACDRRRAATNGSTSRARSRPGSSTRSRGATPTRSRSIRTSTTRRSRACRASRRAFDPPRRRGRRAGAAAPALPLGVRRRRPRSPTGAIRNATSSSNDSRWLRSPRSSSGSGSMPAPGRPRPRSGPSASTSARTCLCLGRVDDGKGARLLAECFTQYKARRGGDLRLVFAGPIVNELPAHPDIVMAGAVAEDVKWGLLRGALALVSPSVFESFSIVLMEAWAVGTPALVNSRCAVTLDHARPLRRRARVRKLRGARGRARPHRRVRAAARRARSGRSGVRRRSLPLARRDRSLREVRAGGRRTRRARLSAAAIQPSGVRHMYARK